MFENDDVILPDDFQESLPEDTESSNEIFETQEEDTEFVEDTKPTEEENEPAISPQTIKIKYNHQEEEISLDEAVQLAQMGKNYPKLQERLQALESDPRLVFVEDLAKEQNMSVNEYLDAVKSWKEQEKINELVQKGISEEVAQELLETRKFREQLESEKKSKQAEEKKNMEFNDFFTYFKNANGRDFDTNTDQIPTEVWEANKNGVPLKYAYMEHHNNQLASQLKILKQNESNKKKAPIAGVSAHGSQEIASEDDFMRGFNSI